MSLGTALRVLRAEGVLAARDRALDRLAEARRRRSFRPAGKDWRAACPVLTVSAYPPAARFGGVQLQWQARLAAEEALGPVARLYPGPAGYRLEVAAGPGRERRSLSRAAPPLSPRAFRDPAFERAVAWAAERVGARTLHVEGAAGLPPESLLALAALPGGGLELVLALHDFALFCPRPHLLEEPVQRFCGYCRNLPRCAACLGPGVEPDFQRRWREAGGALLKVATIVVFPSDFLARTHADLFGPLPPGRTRLLPPALLPAGPLPGSAPSGPVRHLALIGGVQAHKGAEIFLDTVQRLDAAGRTDLSWSAYGGGDPALLARLRESGRVRVRGYYRAGSLPALLRRDRVDLALLPSIVPESFSLVLSECQAAGVPVLAFDLGAIGERLRPAGDAGDIGDIGGGLTVPLEDGAAGLAALTLAVVSGEAVPPPR